ncbi:hypothetical protein [Polaromonas sp. YR568]|uniref:hypothetical protein n=1 Tax=Polaromonas sp. YR568 TaxID=1855301 RepID=UPI00398BD212
MQFIARTPDSLGYDIRVKAGTATFNMGYSAIGAGYGLTVNSCNILTSFEAQGGSKYRLRFLINEKGGCSVSLLEEAADGPRNRSNLLVRRTLDIPMGPSLDPRARRLCSDKYSSVQ